MVGFTPSKIFYEPKTLSFPLGKELYDKYNDMGIECHEIEAHHNIPEFRQAPDELFPEIKRYLIIGTRKTLKPVPNCKTSDFLMPYTSSGCSAMCLYCYLVCTFFKGSYLRVFVNRDEMIAKIKKVANQWSGEQNPVFEIGSNSDLLIENTVTGNLPWTINQFAKMTNATATLPTKFDLVDDILELDHRCHTTIRMSLNPREIVNRIELGTSRLADRMTALNKLHDAGYPTGILIAPVIMIDNWKEHYIELFKTMKETLNPEVIRQSPFEVIFMTYGAAQKTINAAAFPNAIELFEKEKMRGRGRGKYMYRNELREDGELFIRSQIATILPEANIVYVV